MKTLYLTMGITAILLLGNQLASGQSSYVEGVSAIINAGTSSTQIETYSETFETPDIAYYYEAYVEGYLYQNGSLIADGSALGSPYANDAYGYMTQPLHVPDTYEIQSDHYLVAYYTYYDASTGTTYYENPDYFTNDGGYGGSNDFLPGSSSCGCYYETVDYIFLGTTAVQMSSAPPAISSISPTGVSLGTSGTLTINGSDLVDVFTQTATAAISGSGITWSITSQSATQVTINYSVTTSAGTGSRTLTLSDRFGSSSATFNVGDATPQVTSINPSTWNAGATASVTFGGKNFGTAPTLSFSSSQVSATISSASDTQIVANVTVAAAASDQSVTVTVTSHGYNGSGFIQTNNNPSTGTDTATVNAIPAPPPKILRNGTDITGQNGIPVVSGEQIKLTTSVTLPAGLAIANNAWTVAGNAVGGYQASTTGGQVVAITLTGSSVTFYWANAGTSRQVKYTYCMNNNQCNSATATFDVAGPTATGAGGTFFSATPTASAVKVYLIGGNPWLACGDHSSIFCIKFDVTATPPASDTGAFQFVQIWNSSTDKFRTSPATPNASKGPGLDNVYPYPSPDGLPNTTSTNDSPGIELALSGVTALGEEARVFNAKMYLMWDPALPSGCTPAYTAQNPNGTFTSHASTCTSIPVPLGYVSWGFGSDAINTLKSQSNNTTWILNCGAPNPASPSVITSTTFPTWTSTVANTP